MTKKHSTPLPIFDKYYYYSAAVQAPEVDAEFYRRVFIELKHQMPRSLREDFCGTFINSTAWVKLDKGHTAIGVDLDPEPISYGRDNYLPKLTPEQQSRIQIMQGNVLDPSLPHVDLIAATNFSYYIFKNRELLKRYFSNCYSTLNKDGVFLIDCFGGPRCMEPNEEETEHTDPNFSYFWDQDSYDPITHEAKFFIHFKRPGEAKRSQVFSYDWRMWTIRELREILAEAGFSRTHVYWEGTDEEGDGDGIYQQTDEGEVCESWVAYIASEK